VSIPASIFDKYHWPDIIMYCNLFMVDVLFIKTYNQAKQNLFVAVF